MILLLLLLLPTAIIPAIATTKILSYHYHLDGVVTQASLDVATNGQQGEFRASEWKASSGRSQSRLGNSMMRLAESRNRPSFLHTAISAGRQRKPISRQHTLLSY